MCENYHGANYELAKAEADKVDEKLLKHYGMDIVFVLKQVRGQERLIRLIESLNGYKKICGLNIVEKSKM